LQSSAVQTPVKANGKNNKTTFLPFNSDKVTGFLSLSNSVKSGAKVPIAILLMVILFFKMMVAMYNTRHCALLLIQKVFLGLSAAES